MEPCAKPNANAYEVSRNNDGTHEKVISPQSPARAVMIVIVDLEFQYRAHTGEAVEHCGNEREVP